MIFRDRSEAGAILAVTLAAYVQQPNTIVLALPRGGVPVAYEIARRLGLPVDVFIVRKLGVPGQNELAMGAIASGGIRYINKDVTSELGIDEQTIDAVSNREEKELERRERLYRRGRPPLEVRGKTVLLVDDGLATGSTMLAAIAALRQSGPAKIVVAVPAAARETCSKISREVDEIVCAAMPEPFRAVGQWYLQFPQTTDEEVRDLLSRAA
jgi:predicted phosphoribosyltransferase